MVRIRVMAIIDNNEHRIIHSEYVNEIGIEDTVNFLDGLKEAEFKREDGLRYSKTFECNDGVKATIVFKLEEA